VDLTYDYEYLGADFSALEALLKGESAFSKVFLNISIIIYYSKKEIIIRKMSIDYCWNSSISRRRLRICAI
jgi:hypothetical protein